MMQRAMSVRGVQPCTALMLPKKGLGFFFLPENCHHAFCLFLVSFAMLKGKKEQIFFFSLLSAGVAWCFILHKLILTSFLLLQTSRRSLLGHKREAAGSALMPHEWKPVIFVSLKHFCLTASTYHQATPSETCASAFLYSKCHVLTEIIANLSREWSSS